MPKTTPLLENHRRLGGKIVEFAGFLMPIQYSGVMDEHRAVRTSVGLFDVSHMGQVFFTGPGALAAARRMVTNNVLGLRDGAVLYTPICYPDGGIVDDCLVYRINAEKALFVVNASNVEKDFAWLASETGDRCRVENRSDEYALLALQGPRAVELFASLAQGGDAAAMGSFTFLDLKVGKIAVTASRTGYTGEDGFEIACAPADAPALWDRLMDAGAKHGIKPCGLGARDTLRLEAKLPLYGNDIDATTNPLEAGLGWTVKLKEGDFIGRDALLKQKKDGLRRKLVCMEARSRGIARHGHTLHLPTPAGAPMGPAIGTITSGTTSPTLQSSIALGYLPTPQAEPGTRVCADVRGKPVELEVVKGPFYKRAEKHS